jgi:hypothetical protein
LVITDNLAEIVDTIGLGYYGSREIKDATGKGSAVVNETMREAARSRWE